MRTHVTSSGRAKENDLDRIGDLDDAPNDFLKRLLSERPSLSHQATSGQSSTRSLPVMSS